MADTPLVAQISVHAWNADLSMIALSPNNHEVHIFSTGKSQDPSKWERKWILSEHSGDVSGIDWCPSTNQIVTCGHDRNAYFWTFEQSENEWKPILVLLRISRAATQVKWSPDGRKFAVASGAKVVPICSYDSGNHWWISKQIKKHKSSVTSIAWSPNNKFIITGSTDMKARIFSAWLAGIDTDEDDGFGEVFPKQHEFGEVLAEFEGTAWVNSVAWAPCSFRLAFATHASTVHFIQIMGGTAPHVQTVKSPYLPLLDIAFANDDAVIGAGFDMNPCAFVISSESQGIPNWTFKEFLDKKKSGGSISASSSGVSAAARKMFDDASTRGLAFGQKVDDSNIWTRHKNAITNLSLVGGVGTKQTKLTTVGLDGRVLFWDFSS